MESNVQHITSNKTFLDKHRTKIVLKQSYDKRLSRKR